MTDDKGLVDAYSSIYKKEEGQLDEALPLIPIAAKAAMAVAKGGKVAGALGKAANIAGKVSQVADAAGSVGDAANKIRGKGQKHPDNQQEEVEFSEGKNPKKKKNDGKKEDIAIEKKLGLPKRKAPTADYPWDDRHEEVETVTEHPALAIAGKGLLAGAAYAAGESAVKKLTNKKKKEVKKEEVEGGVSVVDYNSDYTPTEIETVDVIDAPKMKGTEDLWEEEEALEERLWDQVAANLTTLGEMRGIKYQVAPFEEEVENLDELKKSTLGSYVAKGSKDLADRRFDQGDSEKRKYEPDEADDKEDKKLDKREEGIARAAKKLSKEEFNVRSPLTFSKKEEEPELDQSELEEKYACSTKKAHKRLKK